MTHILCDVGSKKGIDSFASQRHTVGLPAQVRKLDPHRRVLFRMQNQCPDL